jgi:hypothetical protein
VRTLSLDASQLRHSLYEVGEHVRQVELHSRIIGIKYNLLEHLATPLSPYPELQSHLLLFNDLLLDESQLVQ